MRQTAILAFMVPLALGGCGEPETVGTPAASATPDDAQSSGGAATGPVGNPASRVAGFQGGAPVEGLEALSFDRGDARLNAENAAVTLSGTFPGDSPKPWRGRFTALSGAARMNLGTNAIAMIFVQLEVDSLTTDQEDVTESLKGPDVLDASEYETISFNSNSITNGDSPDEALVAGDLTLRGITRPVTFQAPMQANGDGFALKCEIPIDGSEFGIESGTDPNSSMMTLSMAVGLAAEADSNGDSSLEPETDETPEQ